MQLYHPENILTTSPLVFSGSQKANKMLGIMWKGTETTTGHRFSTRKTGWAHILIARSILVSAHEGQFRRSSECGYRCSREACN